MQETIHELEERVGETVQGFFQFVREQGIVGFAIGFIVGGAVSRFVTSFVNDILDPLIGLAFAGVANIEQITWGTLKVGNFASSALDLVILAAVVYFIFKGFRLDRLDVKKDAAKK